MNKLLWVRAGRKGWIAFSTSLLSFKEFVASRIRLDMTLDIANANFACNCRICTLLNKEDLGAGGDRPWMSTSDYGAFISVGAMVPGWTLLAPRRHTINMQGCYADEEFWKFAREAVTQLTAEYGKIVAFEHGPNASESLTGCGTGHAHLHLVPLNFALSQRAISYDLNKHWEPCSFNEIAQKAGSNEYLFVVDAFETEGSSGFLSILSEPTSQFFRKIIASELGMSEISDYRRYPMLDVVESSTLRMEVRLAQHGLHTEIK